MRQMRIIFLAGLGGFVLGAVLVALSFFISQPPDGAARALHNLLSITGLALGSVGGFLAICTGAVLLVMAMVEPRTRQPQS